MKTLKLIFSISIGLVFYQITFSQDIDSIKILQSLPSIHDSILFATYSKPFSGDCTYELKIDSIKSNKVYISGKYDGNNKCLTDGAKDTINLGLFPLGTYTIYYSFIDTHGVLQTKFVTINFTVGKPTGLNNAHLKKNNIYPNPCNMYLTINLSSDMSGKTFIKLFNSIGQLEFENYYQNTSSELTIDMSSYKKGIYFLRVDDIKTSDIKIIKE